MERATRDSGPERALRLTALALGAAAAALFAWRAATSPDVVWVCQRGAARWITDPRPVDARVQGYRQPVPVTTFTRRFALEAPPAEAVLHVEAARAHRVRLNGQTLWTTPRPDPAWRGGRRDTVSDALRRGENELAIDVWNPRGPPLLRVRLELGARTLASDETWAVRRADGPAQPAVLPDGTRLHPSAPAGPRPARALRERGVAWLALVAAAGLAIALGGPRLARHRARAPALAFGAVAVVWLALLATSFVHVPITNGFDATNHLAYVALLREGGGVPRPDAGWSTFHPPLYHGLVALLEEGAARLGLGGAGSARLETRLVSFAAGLAQAGLAGALAGRLVPGRPGLAAVAILFAGCLPLNLYTAAYVSNEPLHAALFGLALWLAIRWPAGRRAPLGGAVALGVVLGLALLAKVTALVAAATTSLSVLGRAALARAPARRVAALAAAVALPAAALAGWWYLRNWRLYGTPVVANWDLPGLAWWSQPGFRTAAYYLGFGESLRRPVLSGFHSFGDAVYSSFWGDGWIAGRASAAFLPEPWDWSWMALGYWLALPATAVLATGIARSARRAWRPGPARAGWALVVATEAALLYAFVMLTLEVPYFGQAKAPYLLGLVAPLSVQFALGAERCEAWLRRAGGPPAVLAGRAVALATAAAFWLAFAGTPG